MGYVNPALNMGVDAFFAGAAESGADGERKECGGCADEKHDFPSGSRHADECGGDVANGGKGLEQTERVRSGTRGHHFSDERNSDGKFTTNAESCEQSQDGKVPEIP